MTGAKGVLDLDEPRRVGRFEMFLEIASGGFASIHLGRTVGLPGFAKTVAIKRLHRQYARTPDTRRMFLDEARVVARIQHPNVVPTLDLIEEDDELFLVMEFVMGVSLSHLLKVMRGRKERIPVGIVLRVMCGALEGLHAAHQAVDERGEPMCVIHRDVTPDNILVGVDGHARLLDFGVARAMGQHYATRDGEVKGKLAFLSPEQVNGEEINHQTDIFSASAVLWECLSGKRLFVGRHFGELIQKIAKQPIDPPSAVVPGVPTILDNIVMRGLERDVGKRWDTALKMAEALEAFGGLVSSREVGKWVQEVAAEHLAERAAMRAAVEGAPRTHELTIEEVAGEAVPPAAGDLSGTRPVDDESIDDDDSGLPDDWEEIYDGEAELAEEWPAAVGQERPETSGERPVQELADASAAGTAELSRTRDDERLSVDWADEAGAEASVPLPPRRGTSQPLSRASLVIIVIGALAFLGVIAALVVAEVRERRAPARSQTRPVASAPADETSTPSAAKTAASSTAASSSPAASEAGAVAGSDAAPESSDESSDGDAGTPPGGPIIRPGRRPSEFTPGGI